MISLRNHCLACGLSVAIGVTATLGGSAWAGSPLFDNRSETTIRVHKEAETGRVVIDQNRVAYHVLTLYGEETNQHLVAREAYRSQRDEGLEGEKSDLKVDFFMSGPDWKFPAKPTHSLELPNVHRAEFVDGYWKALTDACCDGETYGRLYTYGATKPFLRYNEDFAHIEVPNARRDRFVGLVLRPHMPGEAAERAVFDSHPDAVACLAYAAVGKPLDTVYLRVRPGVKRDQLGLYTAYLKLSSATARDEVKDEGHSLTMWSLDGARAENKATDPVTGAVVDAAMYVEDTTQTLRVRVEADRLVEPSLTGTQLEVEPRKDAARQ
jgi:hypothetical protein